MFQSAKPKSNDFSISFPIQKEFLRFYGFNLRTRWSFGCGIFIQHFRSDHNLKIYSFCALCDSNETRNGRGIPFWNSQKTNPNLNVKWTTLGLPNGKKEIFSTKWNEFRDENYDKTKIDCVLLNRRWKKKWDLHLFKCWRLLLFKECFHSLTLSALLSLPFLIFELWSCDHKTLLNNLKTLLRPY